MLGWQEERPFYFSFDPSELKNIYKALIGNCTSTDAPGRQWHIRGGSWIGPKEARRSFR